MGLDQYMFRVSTPNGVRANRVYNREDSLLCNSIFIPAEEVDEPMYAAIKPFATKVKLSEEVYNMNKIREDFDMSENAYISSLMAGNIVVSDGDKRVEITRQDIDEKYTLTQIRDVYVATTQEIYYWRKNYKISNLLGELIGEMENCGFYAVDRDMATELMSIDPSVNPEDFPVENSNIMYHEWY